MRTQAYIVGYPITWSQEIIEVMVTLGMNEKASSTLIELADPLGFHAATLIKHTLKQGGLIEINQKEAAATPAATGGSSSANPVANNLNTVQAPGDLWVGAVIAILESPTRQGRVDVAQCVANRVGLNYNGYGKTIRDQTFAPSQFEPFFNSSKIAKNDIQDKESAIKALIAKDYNRSQAESALANFFTDVVNPQMVASSQSKVAGRQNFKGVSQYKSMEGDDFLRTQGENFFHYCPSSGSCDRTEMKTVPIAQVFNSTGVTPTQPTTTEKVQPATENTPAPVAQVAQPVKGNKLIVIIGGARFEFYHQGTEYSEGVTKISGSSVRWVLDRRKRIRAESKMSLKALATKICNEHKIGLEWAVDFDPTYDLVDSNGLSDYQLLVREANRAGLFVSEQLNTLTIKGLTAIKDSSFVIIPSSVISYSIKDVPLSGSTNVDSSKLQLEPKLKLDAVSGQIIQDKVDIDPAKSEAPTGSTNAVSEGAKVADTSKPVVEANRGNVKRLKGLPSNFVLPLTEDTLTLEPLGVVRTKGFPGVLSRIWIIDSVTHKVGDGTTALKLYSPIEAKVSTPAQGVPGQTTAATTEVKSLPGTGYVVPVTGNIISRRKMRWGRMHEGVDITCPIGNNVIASNDGVVDWAAPQSGGVSVGYGNMIDIKHTDGFVTRYAHLDTYKVKPGDTVKRGQSIATSGNTGSSQGPHLHFEYRQSTSGGGLDHDKMGLPQLTREGADVVLGDGAK